MIWRFCFLYDRVLKGFTVGEAIFMVLVSWQSLADFSVLKKGIVLRRINAVAFFFMHKVVWLVRHNMPLSSNNDYVFHHCKPVISPFLHASVPLFSLSPLLPHFVCFFSSRAAVIRGSVALQDGSPLVGVNISFPQHPEYGYTISRQDGR